MSLLKRWSIAFILLLTLARAQDHSEVDDEEKDKSAFVPPPFVVPAVTGSPYLVDWFADPTAIGKKWILSKGKKDDTEDSISKYNGVWEIGLPKTVVIDNDLGLIVKTAARHHAIAAKFNRPFSFDGKPLVVQYEVKYEDGQECGGGYVKLLTLGAEQNLDQFTDKTPYTIMFGPDKCGATSKVHFIVRFKNPKNNTIAEHHAKQPTKTLSTYFSDHRTHLYTLILRPDETFIVKVDNSQIMAGSLLTDLEPSITPPKVIDDPEDRKPVDWDEREKIEDVEAKKPDDWDEDAPRKIEDMSAEKPSDWLDDEEPLIPDPDATKPSDWDDGMDGEWEAPKIDNPACKGRSGCGEWKRPLTDNPNYKGKWKPPMITNPAYKGKWKPKQIENPHFFEPQPYSQMMPISALGIELWTMSADIVFDNIHIHDDEDAAAEFAKKTFSVKIAQEAAYESSSSTGQGILSKLVSASEERPWLWAVYVLSFLIPVIVIASVFFGRKSRPTVATYKKTDEPQPDDEMPGLADEEESPEQSLHDSDVHKESEDNKNPVEVNHMSTPSEEEQNEDIAPVSSEKVAKLDGDANVVEQNSPRTRRVRQRKQD